MGYGSPTWVNVPPGTTPPGGAPKLDAATMQALTDAVAAAGPKIDLDFESDFLAPTDGTSTSATAMQTVIDQTVGAGVSARLRLRRRTYSIPTLLTWPSIGLDKPTPTLEIVGAVAPYPVAFCPGSGLTLAQGGDMPPPSQGSILKFTGTGSFAGLVANSNILPIFRDLIVRQPTDPQHPAIDMGWCRNGGLAGRVVIDQGRSFGDGSNPLSAGPIVQPTNTGVEAVIMPGEGNGGYSRCEDLLIVGNFCGLRFSEHFDADRITIFKCIEALRPADGWHAARIGRLSLYWNQIGIKPKNFASGHPIVPFSVQQLDFEEDPVGSNWDSTIYHVDDPNNWLNGSAQFRRMVPASGPVPHLKRRGAVHFDLRPVSTPPRALLDAVGFEPANSTTVVPASWGGAPASQLGGTWGINGQELYLATPSGSTAGDLVVWDTGANQLSIHTRVKIPANPVNANLGIALCTIDRNNTIMCLLGAGTGVASIQKIDTGAYSTLGTNFVLPGGLTGGPVTRPAGDPAGQADPDVCRRHRTALLHAQRRRMDEILGWYAARRVGLLGHRL